MLSQVACLPIRECPVSTPNIKKIHIGYATDFFCSGFVRWASIFCKIHRIWYLKCKSSRDSGNSSLYNFCKFCHIRPQDLVSTMQVASRQCKLVSIQFLKILAYPSTGSGIYHTSCLEIVKTRLYTIFENFGISVHTIWYLPYKSYRHSGNSFEYNF